MVKEYGKEIKNLEGALSKKTISDETRKRFESRIESLKKARRMLERKRRTGSIFR